ncbi:metallophosphoesterase [uncultured Eubacterium sp.]|uniref:metallophosphoesterase n=1 Tax=uncultured Eubacterium sp. TaxID=165185 RepID=UPI002601F24B|nr:metallophosphoesterase [uncultured Eubacterium sp.]
MEYILITAIALIVLAGIVIFLYLQNNILDITQYNIKSNDCGSLKIVQLSDLHSKPFNKVLKKTQELNPDIICITGDYINDKCKNKDKMLNFGKELVKIAKVYYITGNHERRLENFESIMQELSDIGFIVLLNRISVYNDKGFDVNILGLDENQADFKDYKARKNGTFVYKDMSPFFAELENNSGFKIVLSHFPENFENVKEMNYSQHDFDIQLSGHAHGGQFCLPFIGPVFSPGQGLFPKYAKGSFGDRPKLIVSRGLGNAEFPFRLFNHPEINVININQ